MLSDEVLVMRLASLPILPKLAIDLDDALVLSCNASDLFVGLIHVRLALDELFFRVP